MLRQSVADSRGFRYQSQPNYGGQQPSGAEIRQQARHQPIGSTVEPARDPRYPAFAGLMSDGRLVTDYRPKCSKNIRTGSQFDVKEWMQHNAVDIIEVSRRRQVEWSGASLPQPDLAPPPANAAVANADTIDVIDTGIAGGLGIQRANEVAPPLFGTFSYQPSQREEVMSIHPKTQITSFYEGGRNTPRGRVQLMAANGRISRPGVHVETGVPSFRGANESTLTGEPVLQ